ncbi:hypothetical protein L1887_42447 [Cichorium endivia]|nr:hypothetical protein L1887_42447 [Cichorium endivia]
MISRRMNRRRPKEPMRRRRVRHRPSRTCSRATASSANPLSPAPSTRSSRLRSRTPQQQRSPLPPSLQARRARSRPCQPLKRRAHRRHLLSQAAASTMQVLRGSRLARIPTVIPKYIPAGFLPATTMDGTAIRFERRKRMKGWKPPAIMTDVDASQLLERPIHQLLEAVEALKAIDVVEQKEAQDRQSRHAACSADADGVRKVGSQMWVRQTSPRQVHRAARRRENPSRGAGLAQGVGRMRLQAQKTIARSAFVSTSRAKYGPPTGSFSDKSGDHAFKDPHGRPKERVMMISGPPGLGKTTLAHIVGAHAGYNVYELNASDARSAGVVEDVIKMALESGSLKDPRPTLVVIDEIDGSYGRRWGGASGESHGFIRALVRLIESGKGSDSKPAALRHEERSNAKDPKPLLRPIICNLQRFVRAFAAAFATHGQSSSDSTSRPPTSLSSVCAKSARPRRSRSRLAAFQCWPS